MRNDLRTPKIGLTVALCVLLVAIWLVAVYGTYKEASIEKYNARVHPGAVSYGTHSTATIPIVSMPARRSTSVPMISGGAIRSYAYSGHATMPKSTGSSGYRMHTTSSATVHSIGSGGGGGSIGSAGGTSSSSRGITYSGVSVSMPMLAVNIPAFTTVSATTTSSVSKRMSRPGMRRINEDGTGSYEGEPSANGNQYWDGEEWVNYANGSTKIVDGVAYVYQDGQWVQVSDQSDPNAPVGATPWILMAMMAIAYILRKRLCQDKNPES